MAKTYPHAVIYNGKFYSAGEPIEEKAAKKETAKAVEKAGVENESKPTRKSKSKSAE